MCIRDRFKAAAEKFGYKYGFSYDGCGESFKELKQKLKAGDTAIVYLPGHYGTIVDYNAKKDKYLLMDPHYLPKRGTSSFGDWVSQKDLEEGALTDVYKRQAIHLKNPDIFSVPLHPVYIHETSNPIHQSKQ